MARKGKHSKARRSKRKKERPDFEIVAARRAAVLEYLSNHPCVDCGITDIVVLQFDHVRGRKFENVSLMVRMGYTEKQIMNEIAKCEVRCANCHTRKTAREQNWTKTRYMEL